jgi:hypothetical protein
MVEVATTFALQEGEIFFLLVCLLGFDFSSHV